MTRTRLLTTAAVALALSAGAVHAQTNAAPPASPPAAQQKATPDKVAPPMNAGERKNGMPETTGQGAPPSAGSADKPRAGDKPSAASPQSGSGSAAEPGMKDDKSGMKPGNAGADGRADDTKAAPSTSGQGASGARANLTTEQRTRITSVIKQQKVEKANVNISISVGTRVPDTVRYYPLPAEVVTIYPRWRGFNYILVGSNILVIDPATREIVAVLDA